MRIADSTVAMASSRSYKSETQADALTITRQYDGNTGKSRVTSAAVASVRTRHLEVSGQTSLFTSSGRPELAEASQESQGQGVQSDSTQQARPESGNRFAPSVGGKDWLSNIQASIDRDPKVQMLRKMMELLDRITGRRTSYGSKDLFGSQGSRSWNFSGGLRYTEAALGYQGVSFSSGSEASLSGPINGHWTRQTIQSGFVRGEEHTAFSSVGTAVTEDGRTINFGIHMEMSRNFEAAFHMVGKEEVYTDPLVINLDTQAASLSDVSFYFDLDCDGEEEELSNLNWGSGFLALDKNGDGRINDGSELFGAKTGDGFQELAQYDQDGNGWIDENDEVFSRLSVWTQCGNGEPKLLSLSEAGVGAIFLGSQNTQFTLANSYGQENAMVRKSGFYLKENGQASTIQHVDFKV
ncbi:hypothetical protein D7X94_07120 [Acutalibacter sp. 1XD8-33]|uniref:hypothetical protein n=1 Tax=Acutalibacter sp. 1XD8-33 TaxID=2320081 RepID=UPI000EA112D4|nr:hypothetical protein [Acutalibacter sp. 1XD8-33]RKJ40497.1 hypothetical protein D7X94_07120 [Acutalibacter sp. 1XD8-33]